MLKQLWWVVKTAFLVALFVFLTLTFFNVFKAFELTISKQFTITHTLTLTTIPQRATLHLAVKVDAGQEALLRDKVERIAHLLYNKNASIPQTKLSVYHTYDEGGAHKVVKFSEVVDLKDTTSVDWLSLAKYVDEMSLSFSIDTAQRQRLIERARRDAQLAIRQKAWERAKEQFLLPLFVVKVHEDVSCSPHRYFAALDVGQVKSNDVAVSPGERDVGCYITATFKVFGISVGG